MQSLVQIIAVVTVNLRSLPQRLGNSLVVVIGSAGVVAVLVAVLSMSAGMTAVLQSVGHDDRAIVLRNGSASESGSSLSRDAVRSILDAPGIEHDSDGKSVASAEPLRLLQLSKHDGAKITVPLRGVGARAFDLRPEIKIVAGRKFEPSVNEVIVGKAAQAQYRDMNIGSTIATRTTTWAIVGVFESGDAHESEVIADADTVMSSENDSTFASVTVKLNSPASLQELSGALSINPMLHVDIVREGEYYARQSKTVTALLSALVFVVGTIMAVGAVFSALNTMYAAISTRAREIATLRAIGFRTAAIVTSVLIESLLLATVGGVVGALLAWMFFNGQILSTTQGTSNSQLIFHIAVTPALALNGIAISAVIGLIGGLLPALRAARLPIAIALRAS